MTTAPEPETARPDGGSVNLSVGPAGQTTGLVSPRLKPPAAAETAVDLNSHLLESNADRLTQIAERLHEMSLTLENVRVSVGALTSAADDRESRLRRLETWKHRVHAVGTLLAFALGAAVTAALEGALS